MIISCLKARDYLFYTSFVGNFNWYAVINYVVLRIVRKFEYEGFI